MDVEIVGVTHSSSLIPICHCSPLSRSLDNIYNFFKALPKSVVLASIHIYQKNGLWKDHYIWISEIDLFSFQIISTEFEIYTMSYNKSYPFLFRDIQ